MPGADLSKLTDLPEFIRTKLTENAGLSACLNIGLMDALLNWSARGKDGASGGPLMYQNFGDFYAKNKHLFRVVGFSDPNRMVGGIVAVFVVKQLDLLIRKSGQFELAHKTFQAIAEKNMPTILTRLEQRWPDELNAIIAANNAALHRRPGSGQS